MAALVSLEIGDRVTICPKGERAARLFDGKMGTVERFVTGSQYSVGVHVDGADGGYAAFAPDELAVDLMTRLERSLEQFR